jgi:hypothetical protein
VFKPDTTKFSASEWGTQTQDVLVAVETLDKGRWRRIIRKAKDYCGRYRKRGTFKTNYLARHLGDRSGRATLLLNSDEGDSEYQDSEKSH